MMTLTHVENCRKMSNGVKYKGVMLMRNSVAYELWEAAQKDGTLQPKLDAHVK